jgi:hypothetical protein
MTQSVREQLIQSVAQILAPVAQLLGAQVLRSPTSGITREQSPAILIFPESDAVSPRINDRVERQLVLRVVAIAREKEGIAPETIADALLVASHAAVFANAGLNGLCLGVKELDCEWDVEDADALAASIPARYQFTYRTFVHDISIPG